MPAVLLLAGVLGLAVGSFLNVVVWRVPRGESVAHPPSACPGCGHPIRARDNVPVVSWLGLRGRCRDCGARVSVRYPLVEAGTAVLFVLVAWHIEPWAVPAFAYLAAIGVALTLIDLDTHRLPNSIVLPSYPVLGALLGLASWGTGDLDALVRAAIGGTALWAWYFGLCLAYPRGMGFGDVKLAGLLGAALAWLGWGPFAVGSFTAFLLGGLFSVALLVTGRATRRTGIPFGPWMVMGAAVGIAVGEPLWGAYLALLV
jgi:leader peptidase (prepilin peptidase)/N-methyltransferase